MKILIAASEASPYVKTGGLADVCGALLKSFRKEGLDAHVILPLYRSVRERFDLTDTGLKVNVLLGKTLINGRIFSHGPSFYFIECDEFFDRSYLYGTPKGDYFDNAERFTFFDRAVLNACTALDLKPDILHCNDWQTGLIPLYLKTIHKSEFFGNTATIMTIHNLGYQGIFDISSFDLTGLPREWFNPEGIEFYGKMNFLKAGLIAADLVTTVSPAYAKEILTDKAGFGLDGVLRKRSSDLCGILNGIDTDEWDPGKDTFLGAHYDSSSLSGKAICRKALMKECSLNSGAKEVPVIAMVGRLSAQKGIDIFLEAADDIVSAGSRLVILGSGDEKFQKRMLKVAEKHKGKVFVRIGFDEAFAHRIYAGADMFLMPSLYEPCGLGQLIAMRYGTIPVARRTGGLADTITENDPLAGSGTGFLFTQYSASSLVECVRRALSVYADAARWKEMIANAMKMDFSWDNSAKQYLALYQRAAKTKARR